MEALATIGVVCNMLQLVECGYKVIAMAKELHESGQGATNANQNTSFLAQEMQELSLRIMKQVPASNLTDDEEALCRLARQCSHLSNKLLALLDSLKISKQGRKRDIAIGVLRNMRKRREREQLQADLDNCKQQLNIQMNSMSRSDLLQSLRETLSTMKMTQQDMLHLRDQVQTLYQSSRIDSAEIMEFFRKLQKTVETPLQHFAALQELRDPRMHDRFEDVDPAHYKTFEWLLYGPEEPRLHGHAGGHAEAQFQAKSQHHREFVSWLQEDVSQLPGYKRAIFHLTGKPGAGKSTLMKFICQNEATLDKLRIWSGEKQLICATAFFWRLGKHEQKSMAGLAKCLLYQILKAAPGLIPIAFRPDNLQSDTRSALNYLLRMRGTFENYRMIFFIDGLDEFDGRPFELINEIIRWAKWSAGDLKICLSSRQWNEFEVRFEGCPKLLIHEWTHDDISTFVTDKLEETGDFSTFIDKKDLDTLAESVVSKAQGVFIWVRVVLATIEQSVINGDGFRELKEKVAAFPTELNGLYQYIFDSIPEHDRRKAFETLRMTSCGQQSLLQYKFLDDISKDPDYALKLSMEPLPEEDLRRHLVNTRRQINGRCKGFLEIRPRDDGSDGGDEVVSFMHVTASDFLRQPKIEKIMKTYDDGIYTADAVCQTFLAFAKSIDTDHFYYKDNEHHWNRPGKFAYEIALILDFIADADISRPSCCSLGSKIRFLKFLDQINQIAIQRIRRRLKNNERISINHTLAQMFSKWSTLTTRLLPSSISPDQLVQVLAAKSLIFEYFDIDENGLCNLPALHRTDPAFMSQLVHAVLSGASKSMQSTRAFRMLKMLFQAGVSPNVQIEPTHGERFETTCQLRQWILLRLLLHESAATSPSQIGHSSNEIYQYRLVELCLQYGAAGDFILVFGPCYEAIGVDQMIVEVTADCSDERQLGMKHAPFRAIYVDYTLDIVRHARAKGGVLSFKDILTYWFPNNFNYLHELLDKHSPTSSTTEPERSCTPSPSVSILFPEESQYARKDGHDFRKWTRCVTHSEKCFQEFDAKLQGKISGNVNQGAIHGFESLHFVLGMQ